MRKKKTNHIELHIANLKEMKIDYEKKGDVFSANTTADLINKWERIRLGEIKK